MKDKFKKKNFTVGLSPWLHRYLTKDMNINKSFLVESSIIMRLNLKEEDIERLKDVYNKEVEE